MSKVYVIVGAGPSGMQAAITLSKYHCRSILIDENPQVGGMVYAYSHRKRKAVLFDAKTEHQWECLKRDYDEQKHNISCLLNQEVISINSKKKEIYLHHKTEDTLTRLKYDVLMLCTGCQEKTYPFPGWTLQGVMPVGGVQRQIKHNLVKPGQRVALVGTGPLLLLTAYQLTKIGVDVVGVFEAGRRLTLVQRIPGLLKDMALLKRAIFYMAYLKRKGVPVHYGWGVVSAKPGKDKHHLGAISVAPYDRQWRPKSHKAKTIMIDTVGVSHGMVSRSKLSQMAHCEQLYLKHNGGLRPKTDGCTRTNREGVYVAGDSVGVKGVEIAKLEGQLMALTVLDDTGVVSKDQCEPVVKIVMRRINKRKHFRAALDDYSFPRAGLFELGQDDTVVCRCENVSLKEIKAAIYEKKAPDVKTLKMLTRAGMGDCQGATCGAVIMDYFHYACNGAPEDMSGIRPRFPVKPITFGTLSAMGEVSLEQ